MTEIYNFLKNPQKSDRTLDKSYLFIGRIGLFYVTYSFTFVIFMLLKNKTLGSALIIAGTSIGAGMLAMPLTSAGIGFGFTAALLFGLCYFAYSGLYCSWKCIKPHNVKDDGVATLAEKYFGMPGRVISTVSLFVLLLRLIGCLYDRRWLIIS